LIIIVTKNTIIEQYPLMILNSGHSKGEMGIQNPHQICRPHTTDIYTATMLQVKL